MKTRSAIVFVLMFLLAGGSMIIAAGQDREVGIRANVPFAFHVGDALVPAGTYRVAHFNARDLLVIRSSEGSTIQLVPSMPSGKDARSAKLVFHRYGETYFLWQVCIPGATTNELRQSRAEKEYLSRWSSPERTVVVAVGEQ